MSRENFSQHEWFPEEGNASSNYNEYNDHYDRPPTHSTSYLYPPTHPISYTERMRSFESDTNHTYLFGYPHPLPYPPSQQQPLQYLPPPQYQHPYDFPWPHDPNILSSRNSVYPQDNNFRQHPPPPSHQIVYNNSHPIRYVSEYYPPTIPPPNIQNNSGPHWDARSPIPMPMSVPSFNPTSFAHDPNRIIPVPNQEHRSYPSYANKGSRPKAPPRPPPSNSNTFKPKTDSEITSTYPTSTPTMHTSSTSSSQSDSARNQPEPPIGENEAMPVSLKRYIENCFTKCKTVEDRSFITEELKTIIARATAEGRFRTNKWEHEPFPDYPSNNSSISNEQKVIETASEAESVALACVDEINPLQKNSGALGDNAAIEINIKKRDFEDCDSHVNSSVSTPSPANIPNAVADGANTPESLSPPPSPSRYTKRLRSNNSPSLSPSHHKNTSSPTTPVDIYYD